MGESASERIYENRLRFDRDITVIMVSPFLKHSVHVGLFNLQIADGMQYVVAISRVDQGWKKPRFLKKGLLGFVYEDRTRKCDPKAHEKHQCTYYSIQNYKHEAHFNWV